MRRPLFVGSFCRSRGLLSANEKEERNASNADYYFPLQKLMKAGTSEVLWDRLGRRMEIVPMNKCISQQLV